MFRCNKKNGNGFFIKFENGYEVSVQFGDGTYSDNCEKNNSEMFLSSKTAEVAIFSPYRSFIKLDDQDSDVISNVKPNHLLEILLKVSQINDFYPQI